MSQKRTVPIDDWCIPPVRWLQKWFLPPQNTADWQRVSFQPMLYLFTWLAALILLVKGDFTSVPLETADRFNDFLWVWYTLSLASPLAGLVSLWMIQNGNRFRQYHGLWLRLGADIGQFVAILSYCVMRIEVGDYHVYPIAILFAATLFVFHLVIRDVRRLWQVERLATRIRDGDVDVPRS